MAGICGRLVGARGETAVAIWGRTEGWTRAGEGPSRMIRARPPGVQT
jgi:hypothetical protein